MSYRGESDDEDVGGTDSGLAPVQTPPIQTSPPPQGGDDDFEVYEIDDKGEPLNGAPRQDTGSESRMSEADGGDQPVIPQPGDTGQPAPRREPKSARNARRRESRERVFNENALLKEQLEDLRRRFDGFSGEVQPRLVELGEAQIRERIGGLDRQLSETEAAYRAATRDMATAMQSADTDGMTQALERRDEALVRKTRLANDKAAIEKTLEQRANTDQQRDGGRQQPARQPGQDMQQRQQPPAQPLPTRAQHYATEFSREHSWFNPKDQTDTDSQVLLAIDNAVAAAGFDPSSPDYWNEIEDRARERLPHRFDDGGRQPAPQPRQGSQQNQQTPAQQQRRGPPTAGSSDRPSQQGGKQRVVISPARKEGMIMAGAIDSNGRILDDHKYKRLLKSFSDFDRTNPAAR